MSAGADVVIIGAGHNGLACAAYLARAGLSVIVAEASDTPGGCIYTVDDGEGGRLEVGAYEHGGIVGSGVAADLELETRFGLRFHRRDELTLAPCDDGTALAFDSSLDRTLAHLEEVVGAEEAERYRRFSGWATAAMGVLRQTESGPPPTLRELASLSDLALGADGQLLLQALFGSASALLRGSFTDERLMGPMAHWAGHSQQSPLDPGTGAGALMLAGGHGSPAARPVGGSRATIDALIRCLEDAGGELRCGAPVESVVLQGDRVAAVVAGGERIEVRRGVVSAIDARRLFLGLMADSAPTQMLRGELDRMHVGRRNVSELKVDAVLARIPDVPGPPGFERSFMLSANTITDIERSFAEIQIGRLATRGPVMIAFPSVLEPGWAQDGQAVVWLSTFVPWSPADGPWDEARLEQAADRLWGTAESALGTSLEPVRRRLTGPAEWVARNGNPHGNPNHLEMSLDQLLAFRPSPSLARYRTPVPNLFLTGAGTHPGGGITGVPGRNASTVVLEELGLRPRRSIAARAREQVALLRDAARAVRALRSAA